MVSSPDPVRLAAPKTYVTLAASHQPASRLAEDIVHFACTGLAPYKRIRLIEFPGNSRRSAAGAR